MLINVQVLDERWEPRFQASTEINALHLVVVAESREAKARSKGSAWTAGAITFFGKKLIALMEADAGEEVDRTAVDVAMAAWLHDSIYGGVDEDQFLRCKLNFTLLQDGTVQYERRIDQLPSE